MLHPHIELQRFGAVELLRIRREDALGALGDGMIEAITDYAIGVAGRSEIRALVLTGTGRSFVAGADIKIYHGAGLGDFNAYQRRSRRMFDAIAGLPQATIAAVNGYALGGGFELALSCDLILISDKAKLGLPEIKLGLLPGGGGTQRLPRLVGAMRAKELIFSGRMISAAEAVAYGAALEACAPDDLLGRALTLANELAEKAPLALAEAKRVIDDGLEAALPSALTFEQRVLGALYATDDAKEGIAAFVEKRLPNFSAR
ncbi:enoyl-CoA hydratase/isomerase family protein [Devosia ginsengisoli]|uniref:Enoyl-CoA hydratase/isomerase family protein n=1 Tax=Devosia ginsengisoli TaxID=400770 RepID=A0A5B8LXR0_9HYPH|nr:enoyl-CoA hydratase/isomerase family protein [Devosia ginsengisoli]